MIGQMKKADPELTIKQLCQLFGVALSTYYYQMQPKAINQSDQELIDAMNTLHEETYGTYGRRRVKVALKEQGMYVGHFKISRLMKELGLFAKVAKKPHYYRGGKTHPTTPNLLKRQFNPETLNTHWVGDITYIRTHQGWSYLASVMDLGTREVVGYALSKMPDAQLAKQALINAIAREKPDTTKLMFHSDQGVQYSATVFTDALALHGMTPSMSRRGNCWDNAVQERFFRNLKTERLNDLSFIDHQSVVTVVEEYIRFYNHRRLNSAIGYLTPAMKRKEMTNVA